MENEKLKDEEQKSNIYQPVVISRYSVSLVYERPSDMLLRSLITKARSNEEALGQAIMYFDKESKGYNLRMKCVICVAE